MKVLSIKEPFASLILNNKKKIETRSWKTNYRGELYIHASMGKIPKKEYEHRELMDIINNTHFQYGLILCKCNLVDCIYMTEEYIQKIKESNYQEYICGEYEVGRYAWILEGITPLPMKIQAKGKLGIWNYIEK